MGKKKEFLICFVLDETGSMDIVKNETIDGYNEYVNSLRKQKGTAMLLVRFNSHAITVGEPESIQKATVLSSDNYIPDAMTPLYDAVGEAIRKVEDVVKNENVIVVIMTDGLENASRVYKRETLFSLVTEKEKSGWKFVYLGANQDAYAAGLSFGVNDAINYSQAKVGETYSIMAGATLRHMADPVADSNFLDDGEMEQILEE